MKIKSLVASLLLLPALLFAQGPITRNIVTTNTTPFVLSLMTNVSSTVMSNALSTATNISAVVAQDAAQAVVNQKLYQDVSLTIRGYGERAFDADKVVFNDGTIGHRPGTGYGNVYMRDFLMTREGLPERVTLTESWNILNTWSNTFYQAGWFVDSVDAAKQPNATVLIAWNAFTNNGSTIINPALDCAFDFTHAMFMDYRQRGNPLSFTNHWIVASNGMNFIGWSNSAFTAIPSVHITNDLVYLDKVAILNSPTFKWFGEFGFNDGIPKSGYSLWLSLLRFRALNESSEMAAAAGQQTTASNLAYQARSCSTNLITYLWTSTNWFLSCTITNDVADTIGSAFAVWIGAVDKPHALLIASNCVATSPGGVAFATNPSLTNGAPYFPGAGNPWKYSPISSPGTSQNQTAWPGFAGIWNYCCALWDGGVAAQNWYTLAATYATWNGAPIEYLAKPGSGNGTTFYMQGAQALSFFDHVATDFQFKNFVTNASVGNFALKNGNNTFTAANEFSNSVQFWVSPSFGSSVSIANDLFVFSNSVAGPYGKFIGDGGGITNFPYGGLSLSAQSIITNIAFSFASGGTNLDLGNSTNLQYPGLSLTAQTAVTNAVRSVAIVNLNGLGTNTAFVSNNIILFHAQNQTPYNSLSAALSASSMGDSLWLSGPFTFSNPVSITNLALEAIEGTLTNQTLAVAGEPNPGFVPYAGRYDHLRIYNDPVLSSTNNLACFGFNQSTPVIQTNVPFIFNDCYFNGEGGDAVSWKVAQSNILQNVTFNDLTAVAKRYAFNLVAKGQYLFNNPDLEALGPHPDGFSAAFLPDQGATNIINGGKLVARNSVQNVSYLMQVRTYTIANGTTFIAGSTNLSGGTESACVSASGEGDYALTCNSCFFDCSGSATNFVADFALFGSGGANSTLVLNGCYHSGGHRVVVINDVTPRPEIIVSGGNFSRENFSDPDSVTFLTVPSKTGFRPTSFW